MWPSVRCIKLRIGIYLLCTNFLSIERRRRRSRICKHKQRAIRSSKNQIDRIRRKIPLSLTTPSLTILWRIGRVVGGRLYWKGLRTGMWLVVFPDPTRDCDNLVFTTEKMKPFWFFWVQFCRAYDSAYDSDFQFSIARKCSYNPDYDSDSDSNSVASENQPLVRALLSSDQVTWTTRNEEACVKWIANGENVRLKPAFFCWVSLTNPLFLFYVLPSVFKTIFTGSQFFICSPNTFFTHGATHLFKSIGGKFEQSFKKRERNNRENGYKSPTYACVFHS